MTPLLAARLLAVRFPATLLLATVLPGIGVSGYPRFSRPEGADVNATPPSASGHNDGMLGRFLRERRGKLTLAEAGLPARRGSRNGTLTQEDLARLTGYSIRTISALEQGTEHRPSRDLLDAITAALGLTADERRTLWLLAASTPPPEEDYRTDVDPGLARLVQATYPHPACVYDDLWNVQACNPGWAEWICDFSRCDFSTKPVDQRNIAKHVFLNEHWRHVLVEWEREFAPAFMGRMRAARARRPHDRELIALIDELCDRSPDAKRLWDGRTDIYTHPPSLVRPMRRPGHTDPQQPGDEKYHVPVTWSLTASTQPGDHRRIMVLLLPDEYAKPSPVLSEQACAACARQRTTMAAGSA